MRVKYTIAISFNLVSILPRHLKVLKWIIAPSRIAPMTVDKRGTFWFSLIAYHNRVVALRRLCVRLKWQKKMKISFNRWQRLYWKMANVIEEIAYYSLVFSLPCFWSSRFRQDFAKTFGTVIVEDNGYSQIFINCSKFNCCESLKNCFFYFYTFCCIDRFFFLSANILKHSRNTSSALALTDEDEIRNLYAKGTLLSAKHFYEVFTQSI